MSRRHGLTFFAWSDTHFGYEQKLGDADIRYRAAKQMAQLPGWPYPEGLDGCVEPPEFILHCGDVFDGGRKELDMYLHCMRQVGAPSYETFGNHECNNPVYVEWFLAKHGRRYYSFDRRGVRIVCLYKPIGVYDVVPPMDEEQLRWLARTVTSAGPKKPIVVFSHERPDNLPNAREVSAALSKGNVVLMLAGHTHQQVKLAPHQYVWDGRPVVVLGHCRNHAIDPDFARIFAVVRITPAEVAVVPWRWDLGQWAGHPAGDAAQSGTIVYPRSRK